jgi:hypothetical protein
MAICMLIMGFIAGFAVGDLVGEWRWKRLAFEALDLAIAAKALILRSQ